GRRLPGPRQADRADRRADELRRRGVSRALPARPRPTRHRGRAASGRRRAGRPRPDRRDGARVGGPALGGALTAREPAAVDGARSATAAIGMLGGTFDPVHIAHVAVAQAARRELGLDEVLLVPAGLPPHKLGVAMAPAPDRLAMVELAISGEEGLSASRIELDRPGPSWTVDTITGLLDAGRARGREIALPIILSADAFAGLPTWHEPDRLVRLARIAVAPRPGQAPPSIEALPE